MKSTCLNCRPGSVSSCPEDRPLRPALATFQNVQPCGKPLLLALDVSGSMAMSHIAGTCLTARETSAALALITAATEPEHCIVAFSAPASGRYGGVHGGGEPGISPVNLSPRMRLAEAIKVIEKIPMGGTYCALPMVWVHRNKYPVGRSVQAAVRKTAEAGAIPARDSIWACVGAQI
jgi:60 kDa SS-A/Ro ribonucleoprotein